MRSEVERLPDGRIERFRGPLPDLGTGVGAHVVAIDGDRAATRRLRSMGIRLGSDVEISQRRGGGVVVAIDGGRVALARDAARRIVVEGDRR